MDFTKTDIHASVDVLANQIFRGQVNDDYLKARREQHQGFDRDLWRVLADAGLLAGTLSEEFGGSEMNLLEVTGLLEAQGAVLAKLPLWQSIIASQLIDSFGSRTQKAALLPSLAKGDTHLSLAFTEAARTDLEDLLVIDSDSVTGLVNDVAFAEGASAIVLPLKAGKSTVLYLLDPSQKGVNLLLQMASNDEAHYQLQLDRVSIDPANIIASQGHSEDLVEWVLQRCYTAIAAVQLGVVQEAIRRTAIYVNERHQFNKPLSSFQAVSHRAANGYIDYSSLRACVWLAAWTLSEGKDARAESRTAKWWACEAGHRIGHTAQHLHGGLGADVDYPIHRYFLWAKQLEFTLGGAQQQLAQLGKQLADNDSLGFVV